jgi:putative CocE/NonD family hydrolase
VLFESNVGMHTGDGTRLSADIYRPNSPGRFPTLLMRLPYGRDVASTPVYAHPTWYARQGYVVVIQDVRGRGDSGGSFYPGRTEANDGYDAVEWAAALPFSDGNVGMYGFSYQALVQLLTAARQPPALKAIAPSMTGTGMYDGWAYHGGCFALAFNLTWALQLATQEAWRTCDDHAATTLLDAAADIQRLFARLPIGDQPALQVAPYYTDWVVHDTRDAYWQTFDVRQRWADIRVPALHVGGWFDIFNDGPALNYEGLRRSGAAQKLVVGPWAHIPWSRYNSALDFGPDATGAPINDLHVRWFDRWLKGIDNGVDREDPITLFSTGVDRWSQRSTLEMTGQRTLYLSSRGRANSLAGDGRLTSTPSGTEPADVYVYEPLLPTWFAGPQPLLPVIALGPHDQRSVERFNNVLVYTAEACAEELAVCGRPKLYLWISSTAPDTDFIAKLVDVHPDGFAQLVSLVPLRARFRHSLAEPRLLEANTPCQLEMVFPLVCHTFQPRHAIRLEIASSCFPLLDRNPNTGSPGWQASPTTFRTATQTVLHDAEQPSRLVLPV